MDNSILMHGCCIIKNAKSKFINHAGFRKSQINLIILIFISSAFSIIPLPLMAQTVSPLQGGHYTPGIKNNRDMATPPSGLFILWYNTYYTSDTYVDKDGNKFNSIKLNQVSPVLPNIDVDLNLNGYSGVPAFFWASDFKILGGAKYMAGISPSFISADASIVTERGGIVIDTTYTKSVEGTNSGFSDLFVAPFGLSWAMKKFDFTFLYGFYAPTGKYESGSSDVVGLGFWTHQFQGYGYYYPMKEKSTAVVLGATYELNGKIKDADVKPGDRFSLEWGISQYLSKKFEIGVMGSHNWQITDDSGDDVYWDASIQDRKYSLSVNAGYWIWSDRLMANVKYNWDYNAIQRFEMNSWLLNFVFVTNAFTRKKVDPNQSEIVPD